MAMTKPEKCWNCEQKNTMKLVKDDNGQKFYQCSSCKATDTVQNYQSINNG